MKRTILFWGILLAFLQSFGTNYYLSSSSGSDLMDGKTVNTAWQTTNKLNTAMNLLQPGDSVLFKCNDTFNGQVFISKSGNASKNIYFGTYGSGKKPVISGIATISNWQQIKTNIWEATSNDFGNKVTNFFINALAQQIGRWPNATDPDKGYLLFESHSGNTQITDNELDDAIDWTGAEAVVRRARFILDRLIIQSHNKNTLQFTTAGTGYELIDGFGYFIQDDPRTLDQEGEWCYNPTIKKFSLFSEMDPNTQVTSAAKLDYIIKMSGVSYITIENLHLTGSVKTTLVIDNCKWLTIRSNELNYSGENAAYFNGTNNVIFESNLINHTNNNALKQNGGKNFIIRNNTIKNTALIAGMGLGNNGQYNALTLTGSTNLLVEYNTVDSVGYIGIDYRGDTITIKNNVVSNFCMTKDDGGGIYTYGDRNSHYKKLIGNIVFNAIGAPEGTGGNQVAAEGIYVDDSSVNVDVFGNTVFDCVSNGFFIHNANRINLQSNVIYGNDNQILMKHDSGGASGAISNCLVDSNIFVARKVDQLVASFETSYNDLSGMGIFDQNSYCRPFDDDLTIHTKYVIGAQVNATISLDDWRANYQKDLLSTRSPIILEEYKIIGSKSSNYFINSDFESNFSGWSTSSKYGNGRIALATGQGNPGNALKASFISASGKADGYMIVNSNNFELKQGKSYRLRFSAKSSVPDISISMVPRKNGSTNRIAAEKSYTLGTSYRDFETLIIPDLTEPLSSIQFEILEFRGNVWFDNLEIVEVDVEKTNPDDYILFEYNPSKNNKTISIPDNYVDSKGNHISGNIVLKPYSSIILFKKLNTVIGIQPRKDDSNIQIIPNPASNYLTVRSKEEILSICIFEINGQMINSYQSSGNTEFTITDLPGTGIYLVQIQTSGKTKYMKLVIQR
ncbi:MAG TPA: right-handed parallel beta-helix repeat-containing protein [Prolixibacteraceae bacterium]